MDILKLASYYYKICVANIYSPRNVKTAVIGILDNNDKQAIATIDVRSVNGDKETCYVEIYLKPTPEADLRKDSVLNKLPLIRNVLNAMWKNVQFIVDLH